MKKILILVLAMILAYMLTGCKSPSKIAAEKAGEKVLEKAAGVKVDIDGEKMTVEGEDGTQMTMGGNEWPEDQMAKEIPKMGSGTVSYVLNSAEFCTIIINEVKEKDFEKYLTEVESAGFSAEKAEYSDDANSIYIAQNDKGISLQFNYEHETEALSLTAIKEGQ